MSYHQKNSFTSKYQAKKTEVDGIMFDSKREAARYLKLREEEAKGYIRDLQLQVKFPLIPQQKRPDGTIERGCYYRADFCYYRNGEYIIEDVKGYETDVYKIKRKLMLQQGHFITEVRK